MRKSIKTILEVRKENTMNENLRKSAANTKYISNRIYM